MPKIPMFTSSKTKPRTIITEAHLQILRGRFESDPRPSKEVRAELAQQLSLSEESIRIWFQNRRTKARSTGELPAICRKHGNRFGNSQQVQPIFAPNYSPISTINTSPTSLSPTYPELHSPAFNYLHMPVLDPSFNPQLVDFNLSSYSMGELDTNSMSQQDFLNLMAQTHYFPQF